MPLYAIDQNHLASQIKPAAFSKEKDLQNLFQENLEVLLGVRLIATEFTTGNRQRGRIDTLDLDQDGYPTIVEYKKSNKDNVINQGLFYLDWFVNPKGDFTLEAQKVLAQDVNIDWSHPRLFLIAESFSDYDKGVQIQRAALRILLDIPFAELNDLDYIAKDVSKIGHHGTGQVEVKMIDLDVIDKIVPLIEKAYQQMV
jgi:predicted transport protein